MRFRKSAYAASVLFISMLSINLQGQNRHIAIDRISSEKGLYEHQVRTILQDRPGFIWMGTSGGLAKYDGYRFTFYDPLPDCENCDTTVTGSVGTLVQDSTGLIWIASQNGIFLFDPVTERSLQIRDTLPEDHLYTGLYRGRAHLAIDPSGHVWTTANAGIRKFEIDRRSRNIPESTPLARRFELHYDAKNLRISGNGSSPSNNVHTLYADPDGNVWASTQNGLYLRHSGSDQFLRIDRWDAVENSLENPVINEMLQINDSTMLIAAEGGLYELIHPDRRKSKSSPGIYQPEIRLLYSESRKHMRSLYKTASGDVIIGTTLDLLLMKPENEGGDVLFESLYLNLDDPEDIGYDTDALDILEDRTGMLWVGLPYFGMRKLNLRQRAFRSYKSLITESISSTDINPIYEGPDGILWIGTYGRGLYSFDRNTGRIRNFNPGAPQTDVICMDVSAADTFWLGLYGGILEFHTGTGTFHDPLPGGVAADNLRKTVVWDILRHENRVYLGTFSGLFVYDFQSGKVHQFTYSRNVSSIDFENLFGHLIGSRDGRIWTYHSGRGLCNVRFDPDNGEVTVEPYAIKELISTYDPFGMVLYQDCSGYLWIGDSRRLQRLDPDNGEVKTYHVGTGVPEGYDIRPRSILEDAHSNLWLGCQFGLVRFNSMNGEVRHFDRSDGLPLLIHGHHSAFKGDDGRMFFGGIGGFYSFHPDSVVFNDRTPEVVVTELRLFNKPVTPDTAEDAILCKSISYAERIELRHDQNDISLDFAALDYTDPEKNRYAHILENYQDEWIRTDAGNRTATYTHLDPGTYIFRVKGSNNQGVWNEEGTSLTIVIHPPWYRTVAAYFLYGIIIVSLVLLIIAWRTRMLRKEKRILEKEVSARTRELKEAMGILEKQKDEIHIQKDALEESHRKISELDAVKTRFFTNISHEFRTLLTLIRTPVENLLLEEKISRKGRRNLDLVTRTTVRLMTLINQLLDISKIDKGDVKLVMSHISLPELLRPVAASFAVLAETKGIAYIFHLPETDDNDWVDTDKLDKIISNLLSNAFRFTGEGGRVELDVTREPGNDTVKHYMIISVADTGQGIAEEEQVKIFDRFYQAEAHLKKEGGGTGIGLALTRDLVALMHGSISLESAVGRGSCFRVRIPLGLDHLGEEEFVIHADASVQQEESATHADPFRLEGTMPLFEKTADDGDHPEREAVYSTVRGMNIPEKEEKPLILVAEDNADVRWLLKNNLEPDFHTIEAVDGSAGLKLAGEFLPDLVIADLMMPRMDGTDLCKRLKNDLNTSHIPVIMLTAKASTEERLQGLETGADDYIAKPFDIKEVKIRAKNLIDQRKRLREKFSGEMTVKPTDVVVTSVDEEFIKKAISVVERGMRESDFNVGRFCERMHMSRSTLFRKLEVLTNQSPVEFIRTIRLKRAASLLEQNFGNVTEVAMEVGFDNPSYFTQAFRKAFQISPLEFMRSGQARSAGRSV